MDLPAKSLLPLDPDCLVRDTGFGEAERVVGLGVGGSDRAARMTDSTTENKTLRFSLAPSSQWHRTLGVIHITQ